MVTLKGREGKVEKGIAFTLAFPLVIFTISFSHL